MKPERISSAISEDIVFNHLRISEPRESNYSLHFHDRCEIIFFIKGKASYTAEGRSYNLCYGDVIVSRPSVLHAVLPKSDSTYERINVILNEKLLPASLWSRLKSGSDIYRCGGNERITELFSKLDSYYLRFEEAEYCRLAFNIIEEILLNLSVSALTEEESIQNPLLEKALRYIKENLTVLEGVEEVSRALYITKSHLHHLFADYLQLTPKKYITSKRLLLAQKRIRRGEKPTAVYSECGFEDYATFFRNYKKYFGYSPAEETRVEIKRKILS